MKIFKKFASVALASAIVASAVVVVASPATAAPIAGATLTITPTSGNVNTDVNFLDSIAASAAAPVGFRALGSTVLFQNGNRLGVVSTARTTSMVSTAGTNGLDGNTPVFMDRSIIPTNNFVSNKLLNDPSLSTLVPGGLITGPFELRFYYFASSTAPSYSDPYISLAMTYNATSGAWALDIPATPTSVSLTAGTTANAGEVALSASVKDLAGVAVIPGVVGNIVFKEGATTVATVPATAGVASALLTGVANGSHTYTADFVSGNATYGNSSSAVANVTVGGQTGTTNITVAIPAGVGTLTLSGVTSTVNMGTAVLGGGTLNAQGTVNAVVTDTRQLEYPAWSLTGIVGDFTSGANTLNGKYLGWTPAVTGDATNSVAGPVVLPAPATTNGIKTSSVLATGAPFDGGTITNASALLQLKAPSNTRAGTYSATLTLTLI